MSKKNVKTSIHLSDPELYKEFKLLCISEKVKVSKIFENIMKYLKHNPDMINKIKNNNFKIR